MPIRRIVEPSKSTSMLERMASLNRFCSRFNAGLVSSNTGQLGSDSTKKLDRSGGNGQFSRPATLSAVSRNTSR